jgi:hypothetical protein
VAGIVPISYCVLDLIRDTLSLPVDVSRVSLRGMCRRRDKQGSLAPGNINQSAAEFVRRVNEEKQ